MADGIYSNLNTSSIKTFNFSPGNATYLSITRQAWTEAHGNTLLIEMGRCQAIHILDWSHENHFLPSQ